MLGRSYTGRGLSRQSAPTALLCASLSLAGCAGLGMPFSEAQMQAATSSRVAPARAVEVGRPGTVDPSDWEAVRKAVSGVPADAAAPVAVAWRNIGTGSDGVVTVAPALKKAAALCRAFTTTLNAPRGVRSYRGEACQTGKGVWTIASAIAEDSA